MIGEVEKAKKIKRLFEEVGVKKVHYYYKYFGSEDEQDICNFSGNFLIEFNDGTVLDVADGEYGDLTCVDFTTKEAIKEHKKKQKEYCKEHNYIFRDLN